MIETKEIKLSNLHPNTGQIEGVPTNPRKAEKGQIDKLKKSIEETPEMLELRELVAYDNGGELVIVGGNMRYKALKELGHKTALVKVLPADTPKEVINAFIIKDNAQFGEWDTELLANDWDKDLLEDWGVEIDWGKEAPEQPKEAEEDDFSEEEAQQAPAIVKKGEIWQLGEHRLMCGDSTDIEQVKMLMGGVLADMVFTDPPYGVSYTEKNEYLNSLGKPMACPKAIENDSKTPTEMYDFWLKAFRVLYEVTNEKMAYYITAPQGGDLLLLLLLQAVRDAGFALKHQLIWNKNNHVLGRCDYNYKHEPIIYGWKIKGTHDFVGGGKFKTSVWDIPKPLRNDLHPTMKPIELVAECLKDNTREGNVVIDVFGGSGTTLIAAEQLNRKAFLMEFDEHYCDVIIARWEKLTGKKAERITHA
jgi:DNA modification methylase